MDIEEFAFFKNNICNTEKDSEKVIKSPVKIKNVEENIFKEDQLTLTLKSSLGFLTRKVGIVSLVRQYL